MSLQSPLLGEIGVIALVPDKWGPWWQARHQIAMRLARYFHVVWVDCPPTWQDSLRWFARRLLLWQSAETPLGAVGFQVYQTTPWSLNLGRPAWLRQWFSRERLKKAERLLRNRGCSKVVLYLWRSEFANSLDLLHHQLSCYHIDDEYSFSPLEQEPDAKEIALIRRVDQVFIHSPVMMKKKGTLNPNTLFVPNGVDYQSYITPRAEPVELRSIPKPRIGYIGVLKRMLDWPLLLELSRMHPEWSFVFVGHILPHLEVQEVREQLFRRPNVHFVGLRPSESLPGYVQHMDVCIMPYTVDDYTKYIYPLKLHEYLAGGSPVVGSQIPALQAFEKVVLLASGPHEWSSMITLALSPQENSIERRNARQHVAARHDWDLLVEKLASTLARRLGLAFPDVIDHGDGALSNIAVPNRSCDATNPAILQEQTQHGCTYP